jgi:hypothetical protein
MVPIRSSIESRYGQGSVEYNPQTGVITLYDPRTGRVGTIAPDAYVEQGGTAYINPDYIRSWLNGSSGGSSSTQTTPAASTTTATTANTRTGTAGGLNPTEQMIIHYKSALKALQRNGLQAGTKILLKLHFPRRNISLLAWLKWPPRATFLVVAVSLLFSAIVIKSNPKEGNRTAQSE